MNSSVGQQLRSAREKLGISLDDAAHETHIRLNYLQELEDDHPEMLHSAAQARGFLRLYADFLKLPYTDLLSLWDEKAVEEQPAVETKPENSAVTWLKKMVPARGMKEETEEPALEKAEQPPVESALVPAEPSQEATTEESSQEESSPEAISPEEEQSPIEETSEKEETKSIFTGASGEKSAEGETQKLAAGPAEEPKFLVSLRRFLTDLGAKVSHLPVFARLRKPSEEAEGESASAATVSARSSVDLFCQIGLLLQNRRKMMDLSLADIENFTNLKRAFLVALEEGRFGDLPSTVQGRGMLNNYAKFLGMEETSVMELYARALQLQREERLQPLRQPAKPPVTVKVNIPERWRKILNPDLIIGSVLIVGLFVFIVWGAVQVFNSASQATTQAPSISDMLEATASPTVDMALTATYAAQATVETTPLPGVSVMAATPTIMATVNTAPLQVYIIAHDRAYLKVEVDGKDAFMGRVVPNNVYTYSGEKTISLLTGNASALEVYFNQKYIGKLGGVGEVRTIDFTLSGLSTAEPENPATSTPEPNAATLQAEEAASKQ